MFEPHRNGKFPKPYCKDRKISNVQREFAEKASHNYFCQLLTFNTHPCDLGLVKNAQRATLEKCILKRCVRHRRRRHVLLQFLSTVLFIVHNTVGQMKKKRELFFKVSIISTVAKIAGTTHDIWMQSYKKWS